MVKKLLLAFIMLFISALIMFSCGPGDNGSNENTGNPNGNNNVSNPNGSHDSSGSSRSDNQDNEGECIETPPSVQNIDNGLGNNNKGSENIEAPPSVQILECKYETRESENN